MPKDIKRPNAIEKALEIMLKFQEFVRQDPMTRQYFVGTVFYRFLENLNSSNNLSRMGRRFMEEVASATLETVHLNIVEGNMRICIDTIESPKVLKAGMPIGNQSPLYAGASAKCLLAFSEEEYQTVYLKTTEFEPMTKHTIVRQDKLIKELKKIKKQGYALSLGERTPGLGSLSAPVFNYKGLILASLSLAVPEIRFKQEDHLSNCIHTLTEAAKSFSKAMGLKADKF